MTSISAAAATAAISTSKGTTILAELAETTKFAVITEALKPAETCSGVVEEVATVAREEVGIALRHLVSIVAPRETLNELTLHQKPRSFEKAKAKHNNADENGFNKANIPKIHGLDLMTI